MAWEAVQAPEPVPASEPESSPASGPPVEEPTVREALPDLRPKIFLVDDDPDLREVVTAMLEAVGLSVTPLGSAEEALAYARSAPPNLIVLDWNLPGMSGLEMCKVVRADAGLRGLPLLFLTAHSATQDMVDAFAAGADDYVVKPFRAAELGARIFGLLRRTRGAVAS
jgi:two-component system phosphate regulon response regulator PhoB